MKKFLFVMLTASVFTSCTIVHSIHFREDNAGDYSMKLDMSLGASLMGDSIGGNQSEMLGDFDKLVDQIREIPGIANVKLESPSAGVIEISYGFDGLASLNTSTETQTKGEEDFSMLKFSAKGKTMIIDMKPSDDMAGNKELTGMEDMGEMLTYSVNLQFDRKIAGIKSSMATLDEETNSVAISLSLSEIMEPKKKWITKIKFK